MYLCVISNNTLVSVVKSGHIVELHVSLAGRKDPSPARQVGSAAKTGAEVSSPFYIGGMPDGELPALHVDPWI